MAMSLIHLDSVWKQYQLGETQVAALKGINLHIDKGEFVAVWGPSGSGKSTLCNLIGEVDLPTSGTITINGRNIQELTDDERSDHRNVSVGFVFQKFNLLQVLTTLENVMLPLNLRGGSEAEARDRAVSILNEMGLSAFMDQRPDKLSGGQQQRVAIARALVTNPPLVIADEPTANLDSENANKIVDLMRDFNRTRGTTFIFSTHDQRLLDRVKRQVRLQDGEIVEDKLIG